MALDARLGAAVFAGGAVGALARAALTELAPVAPGSWPWTTLLINLAGAALLAAIVTRDELRPAPVARAALGTGLCGALTTFSTLQLELLRLLDRGAVGEAAAYAGASVLGGLLGVVAVTRLVRTRVAGAAG